jgi:hypothetical protein
MKKILFLLAIMGLVTTGCQSTNGNNSSAPDSNVNALPNQGVTPVGPVGGGTTGTH